MTIAISRPKISHWSARALFACIPAAGALALPMGHLIPTASAAPQPSSASVAVDLAQTPSNDPRDRVATIEGRLARKRAHLATLRARLADAQALTDSVTRRERVSRYAYQAFYVESRIAAEEDKRRDAEARLALTADPGAPRTEALVKERLDAVRRARRQTAERLLQRAARYRALITETQLKIQLDQLVKTIESERERQS